MRASTAARLLACILCFWCLAVVRAQNPGFEVPDGRRHFIVLFDTSASMWGTETKRRSLASATHALADALFEGHSLENLPRYRAGQDLLTIVQFGFDRSRDHSHAYERLKFATLGEDYVRLALPADSHVTRASFLRNFALRQADKTNINALAWALPLGLRTARIASETQIQRTYVILVNDAQLNDGSMALERYTLGIWLGDAGHQNLERAEAEQTKNVRLVDAQGSMLPLLSKPFGEDRNRITLSAFLAQSVPSLRKAGSVSGLHPLEGADVAWVDGGLRVSFKVPNELRDHRATLTVANVSKPPTGTATLERATTMTLPLSPDHADETVKLVLRPELTASNDLLGTQTFTIPFEEPIRLPPSSASASAKRQRTFIFLLFGAALIWGTVTLYRHGWLISHLRLRLPGYAAPFDLPPLSQMRTARFVVRVPAGNGEWAMSILPPSGWPRKLLYRNMGISWDNQLTATGSDTASTHLNLAETEAPINLKWASRSPEATEARVVVERKLPLFPAHRLEIVVRFSALPRLSGNHRIPDRGSTS